ncbi:NDT-like domain-containing protein raw isoform X1 [Musca autumnalis]|uniref:NDT-like domain-containing protein raw isoform X1 n=2 Tax=Musca autumnalis TaxID=221902 RepID=UPI003CEDCB24
MGLRAKTATTTTTAATMSSGNGNSSPSAKHKLLNGARKFNKAFSRGSSTFVGGNGSPPICTKIPSPPCLSPNNGKNASLFDPLSYSIRTTFRSSSTSALMVASMASNMRPQTLNVHNHQQTPADHTQLFLGEVLAAWRAKARCNVVPAERTQELFQELSFHPNDKQISDMLQTAKLLARKGSRQSNGLTFGEFCVLAADLKRFRTSTFGSTSPGYCDKSHLLSSLLDDNATAAVAGDGISDNEHSNKTKKHDNTTTTATSNNCSFPGNELRSTKSFSSVEDCHKNEKQQQKAGETTSAPVEVFLGGSCNPTTWRADVAIPALKESGISFYNPQVSDWTPDLIELEHRAKEKARVLFFVMDSETRASAGAIEAAHIAGQNCKQLVLVLHPYRPNQNILNEHISQQEYIDLTRNQLILRELVTRRGLPVLNNIPSGLQRTKEILAGFRDPPSNIASILVVIRGAFDRVNPVYEHITVEQCQRALLYLGYAQSLVNMDNLQKIIAAQREALQCLNNTDSEDEAPTVATTSGSSTKPLSSSSPSSSSSSTSCAQNQTKTSTAEQIDFNLFCVISAYLSVLQQEIHESGCISPIKGTNVPPPPVYLSNLQGEDTFAITYFSSKNISRTSSNASVPGSEERLSNSHDLLGRNRDSGTSSPQPTEPLRSRSQTLLAKAGGKQHVLVNVETIETTEVTTTQTIQPQTAAAAVAYAAQLVDMSTQTSVTEEESDSNDSVFSSSSSINSINYCDPLVGGGLSATAPEFRDVYLGGSCYLRTKWRQELAIPYFKSKGITFHLPALHESLNPSQLDLPDKVAAEDDNNKSSGPNWRINSRQPTSAASNFMRTRRKCRTNSGTKTNEETVEELTIAEESLSWTLSPVRPNLFNPSLLDSSRVLLFVITNETRSLAPMTLAAHCIGLMYNVVLAVQMLPDDCVIGNEKLTPTAIKDYNRGRSYLIDLAKRQGVPVFNDIKAALECTVEKIQSYNSRRYE